VRFLCNDKDLERGVWDLMFPEHGTRVLLPLQHKKMSHSSSIVVGLCHCTMMVRMTAYVRISITTFLIESESSFVCPLTHTPMC